MSEPLYFDVPIDAKYRPCRACRKPITFVVTANGKRMPVDLPEKRGEPGRAHFQTCTHPDRFSRRQKR